jgi:hypothetical protein
VEVALDHLGVPLEKQRERASDRADVDRLPETVQYEDLLGQNEAHGIREAYRFQLLHGLGQVNEVPF